MMSLGQSSAIKASALVQAVETLMLIAVEVPCLVVGVVQDGGCNINKSLTTAAQILDLRWLGRASSVNLLVSV